MRRREFLQGAAIAPAAVAAAQWSVAADALRTKTSRISAVVYDERYADCREFADAIARQGAAQFPVEGDAGRLWYGVLREHLSRVGGRVAGMTTDSDLGVSRMCGREAGMRIAYEGSHDGRASHCLKHTLRGAEEANVIYEALLRADRPWAESIATALSRPPFTDPIVSALAGSPTLTTAPSAGHPGYLTSWLLVSADFNPRYR